MNPNPFLGVLLHSIGGLAAASFYIPYKAVRRWSWETYWLAGGVFSWLIAPWVMALLIVPGAVSAIAAVPLGTIAWTYLFGVLWGIGGLTFGLSMRYLGIALGYAIALGFCAAFGTLMPPIVKGQFGELTTTPGGQLVLIGVGVCLLGIATSGAAGMFKERELPAEEKTAVIKEFNFGKGVLVAVFAGVMSACMSYAFQAGKPIAKLAIERGAPELWQNLPVLIVVLAGGFTTNFLWCVGLSLRSGAWRQYFGQFEPAEDAATAAPAAEPAPTPSFSLNWLLCALAGTTWYLQFFFYGMGTTKMGRYDFSSWTLHMAAIIIFSTVWGIGLKEWKGTGLGTRVLIAVGLFVLIGSTVIIGYGNYVTAHP
jgi:L-rhamnose-H+ transport protein